MAEEQSTRELPVGRSAGGRPERLRRARHADDGSAGAGVPDGPDAHQHVHAGARGERTRPTRRSAFPTRITRCRTTRTSRPSWNACTRSTEYHFRQFAYLVDKLANLPEGRRLDARLDLFLYGTGSATATRTFTTTCRSRWSEARQRASRAAATSGTRRTRRSPTCTSRSWRSSACRSSRWATVPASSAASRVSRMRKPARGQSSRRRSPQSWRSPPFSSARAQTQYPPIFTHDHFENTMKTLGPNLAGVNASLVDDDFGHRQGAARPRPAAARDHHHLLAGPRAQRRHRLPAQHPSARSTLWTTRSRRNRSMPRWPVPRRRRSAPLATPATASTASRTPPPGRTA